MNRIIAVVILSLSAMVAQNQSAHASKRPRNEAAPVAPAQPAPAPVAVAQPTPAQQERMNNEMNPNTFEHLFGAREPGFVGIITNYLLPNQACAVAASSNVSRKQWELNQAFPGYDAFHDQFVTIPAGVLPSGVAVASFEADKYPVTRELWATIMGEKPVHFPDNGTWAQDLRKPVTHVSWVNADGSPAEVQEFLLRLNRITASQRCTYDLPTDQQLHYRNRGDVTGQNQDRYSTGVTEQNVDDYVTHYGNSNGQIQPVGIKLPNAFGVELGNVWVMSKDLYNWGQYVRGGSWGHDVSTAGSGVRNNAYVSAHVSVRAPYMGFALVRICVQ